MSLLEEEFDSEGDTSDDDFKPEDLKENDNSSEDSQLSDDEDDIDASLKQGKRRKIKKNDDDIKKSKIENKEIIDEKQKLEERKRRGNELFKQLFKKKTTNEIEASSQQNNKQYIEKISIENSKISNEKPNSADKMQIKQVYDFAGEKITVTKEVDKNSSEAKREQKRIDEEEKAKKQPAWLRKKSSSLADKMSLLTNKKKMSIMHKSNMDWNVFKTEAKIEKDLEQHNRSKDSFISKQTFLEKTDLKQHEIDKSAKYARR